MQQHDYAAHNEETTQVLADHREREPLVTQALRDLGADVLIGQLRVGDYSVDGRLVVERKTARDLAVSVMSGRLFRQARSLAAVPGGRVCLIIEGPVNRGLTGGLSRSGFHGTLVCLTLVFGLPTIRTATPAETASVMMLAATQLRRRSTVPPRRLGQKYDAVRRTQHLMLQSIRGVGPSRSGALLAAFASPAGVAAATVEQIASVPGIGHATARRIASVMRGKVKPA
jgi:DNA excision repair protein ERCC-4